jgi:LysR family transcriptional regulator, hydrogen peroxide-inducible genes activator
MMRDLPTLKQLEYFVALAEAGSFRAAAERCGISQPSLSVQLAELERRLGQTLVERHRSGVILTAAGREAHERATAILDGTRHLVARLAARRDGMTGTVRLGASPTLGPYLLPHAIARLHAEHPDLRLAIREAPPESLVLGLARGEYDVGLLQLPVRGEFAVQRLFREPLELVVAADHPLATRGRATRADLAGETVLSLGPTFALRQQVAELCDTLGARLRSDYEGTSLDAVRQMAGMGMGLAFLPSIYVRSTIGAGARDVAVVPLEGPRILRSVGLVSRGTVPPEPAIRLARMLQSVAREVFPGFLFLEPLQAWGAEGPD